MVTSDLRPMLAQPGRPDELRGGFAHEFKWDGIRALAHVRDGGVTLASRSGRDVTGTYPELAAALASARGRGTGEEGPGGIPDVVLDGEVVALEDGRPSFALLQRRMNVTDEARAGVLAGRVPVALLAFDLLRSGQRWMLGEPYEARREALEALALPAGGPVQVPPAHDDLGEALRVARELGLEGVVAKRLGSTYQPGRRSPDWRKLRFVSRQELVVGGLRPGRGGRRGRIGSLLVGYHDPAGRLRYAGAVGSGLTERMLTVLEGRLRIREEGSPFADPVPHDDAVFVDPELVVEVQFREWTPDGVLRQPSLEGLRDDKPPDEVVREPV